MKKNLLKKVLALALSATMALTPVVSYAGDEVVEEVVWEATANDAGEEQSSGDEASEEQLYSEEQSYSGDEENTVDEPEVIGFEENNEEDNASDDAYFAFSDVVNEDVNEVDFVTEDEYYSENQDIYEAISEDVTEEQVVSDDTALFGDELIDESSAVDEQIASDEVAAAYAGLATPSYPTETTGDFCKDPTKEDTYLIKNLAGLIAFRDSVNAGLTYAGKIVKLDDAINLSGSGWTPIGTGAVDDDNHINGGDGSPKNHDDWKFFEGTFDGNSSTISGLTITSANKGNGLFGATNGATIKNLTISGASISGEGSFSGAAVGYAYGGTINSVYVDGSTSISGNHYIGGAVGFGANVTLTDVRVRGTSDTEKASITAADPNGEDGDDAGGVIGYFGPSASASNCVVDNVTVTGERQVGGFAGLASACGAITNCTVSSTEVICATNSNTSEKKSSRLTFGGMFGAVNSHCGTVTGALEDVKVYDATDAVNANVRKGIVSAGYYDSNKPITLPTVTVTTNDCTLEVASASELGAFRDEVNRGINYTGVTVDLVNNIQLTGSWTPAGQGKRASGTQISGTVFSGEFNGNKNTISGLTVTDSAGNPTGLFGATSDATIKDLTLSGVTISGTSSDNDANGALIGLMSGGSVTNVVVGGTSDQSSITGYEGAGGVVGRLMKGGTISECKNYAAVSGMAGSGYNIGGIVGVAYRRADGAATATITKCENHGQISASGATTSIGGIAGLSTYEISNCTNNGVINGTGAGCVGGIVGKQQESGSITGCTNNGSVTGYDNISGERGVGGIVGWIRYQTSWDGYKNIISVTENTNKADISGDGAAGGIVGVSTNGAIITSNIHEGSISSGTKKGAAIGLVETGINGYYTPSGTPAYAPNTYNVDKELEFSQAIASVRPTDEINLENNISLTSAPAFDGQTGDIIGEVGGEFSINFSSYEVTPGDNLLPIPPIGDDLTTVPQIVINTDKETPLFTAAPPAGATSPAYSVIEEKIANGYRYLLATSAAKVENVFYATFEEAAEAAGGTKVVELLKDGLSYTMSYGETLKVVLGTNTLTVKDPDGNTVAGVDENEIVTYTCTKKETVQESTQDDCEVDLIIDDKTDNNVKMSGATAGQTLKDALTDKAESTTGVTTNSKVEIDLIFESSVGNGSTEAAPVFDLTPSATLKVYANSGDAQPSHTEPLTVTDAMLAGSTFKFILYLSNQYFAPTKQVKVTHKSADGNVKDIKYYTVQGTELKPYIEIETTNFSSFTVTRDAVVTFNARNATITCTYTDKAGLEQTVSSTNATNFTVPMETVVTVSAQKSSASYTTPTVSAKETDSGATVSLVNNAFTVAKDTTVSATSSYSGSTGGSTTKTYTLSATAGTGGSVSVSPSKTSYSEGAVVTITATADSGYTFSGWSGDVTGTTNPTTINMTGTKTSKSVTATFTKNASTSAEAFIKEVKALPDSTTAAPKDRDAIDKALKDYDALSATDKANADVVAAKATLDAINTAVSAKEKADADAVTKAINALPSTVTASNKADVEAARKAYDALTPTEKKKVGDTTLAKLTNAEAAIKADEAAAKTVDDQIKALPDKPTLADKEQVEAADKAYKALTDAQKSYIPTADQEKLKAAVKAIEDAEKEKEAADKAAADAVKKMIDDLPEVKDIKPENKASVDAVQKQYDKLTEDQKALVPQTEKDKLAALQKALAGDDAKIVEEFTKAVNAVPGNKAGEGKGLLDAATAIYQTMTDAQKALVTTDTMDLYNEEVEAFKKGRKFRSGDGYYKVLSNGDVTYLYPADKDVTGIVVPNQVKKGKFMFKVIKISTLAFDGCEKLKWVVIHKNIRVIGEYAFNETTSLIKINVMGSGFVTGKVIDAFGKAGKKDGESLTVKVPSSKVSSYNSLFKGEGKLNQKAKVVKAA